MDSNYGLLVKGFELGLLAQHGVNYYPHDWMEFHSNMNDETVVEIDFETKKELEQAMQLLGKV